MSDQPQDAERELVMPFTVCQTQGGPYEDTAFVAGWECGALDAVLTAARGYDPTITRWVNPALLPQLDLIAMKHGLVMERGDEFADGEYVRVTFGTGSDGDPS